MARQSRRRKKDFFDKVDYTMLTKTSPVCSHFGECGGCRFQDLEYASQVVLKEEYLKELFSKEVSVVPATNPLGYRNRMDFVYHQGVLGLRKKGDFKTVIDISECHLIPEQFRELFKVVKSELKNRAIDSYDILEQSGFLRYVVFRFAPYTNQVMLILTTSSPVDEKQKESFLDLLNFLSERVTSVYWYINDTITDVSIPFVDPVLCLGEKTITETLGDVSLSFGPLSFFQANSSMSEKVFADIKEFVSGETVDLCCGVGAISLFVADKASSVSGIEEVSQAIDFAKENAQVNNVSNALFFADDMKNIAEYAPLHVDTLILDPPRAGLGSKTVKNILLLDPDRIVYMSCNPKTQKVDLDLLTQEEKYTVTFLKGYDLFPQTPHVETLCVLERAK